METLLVHRDLAKTPELDDILVALKTAGSFDKYTWNEMNSSLYGSRRRTTPRRCSRGRSRPAGWWSTRPRMTTTPLTHCTWTPWRGSFFVISHLVSMAGKLIVCFLWGLNRQVRIFWWLQRCLNGSRRTTRLSTSDDEP